MYTLTDQDITAYLASKQEHESIGLCGMPTACLLANVTRAKYPHVCSYVYDSAIYIDRTRILLSSRQRSMLYCFDCLTQATLFKEVSKHAFVTAWQRLLDQTPP